MDKIKMFFKDFAKRLKHIYLSDKDRPSMIQNSLSSPGFSSLTASILSVVIGLLFGFFLLLILNPSKAGMGLQRILVTGISAPDKFAKVLYMSAPLIMVGLAVGFAFKTGLFNIGATGQYTIGAFFALFSAIVWGFPWYAAILAAMAGGALWGAIPGFFKAFFNVNEVITSIMFNWIGMFLVNLLCLNTPKIISDYWGGNIGNRTANLAVANPSAIIPKWGLDKLFDSNYMNIGVFIAVLIAICMFVILNKTTFGYELKACGYNRNASVYAGMNAKRSIILSMVISGALAGIGGGLYYLTGIGNYNIEKLLLAMGFNGIPVALLGGSNPLGIILSGIFISYIQVGGEALQPTFSKEIIDIIIAVIIYMSALSLLVKLTLEKLIRRRKKDKILHCCEAKEAKK
jgi:simple sugar transport system permease protein